MAVVYKKPFKCKPRSIPSLSFEATVIEVNRSYPVLCAVIFRPPKFK